MLNGSTSLARSQRGAVAIIVALSIAVLIGMIGLAIDLGRMFVIKTELQNAADACALAAARELDGIGGAKQRADAAGILVGTRNDINFQGEDAPITEASLTYSDSLSPNSAYNRSISDADARFAMCTVSRPDIGMLFMGVLGFGDQTVNAYAVSTLAPSQTTCAIPIGICKPPAGSSTAPFGLVAGKWYSGKFGSGGGATLTGSYNWIDFNPNGGGANELKDLLSGVGQCELPPVGTCVGQQGQISAASDAWNTRFGLYKAGYNPADNPPDKTGLAYTVSGLGSATRTTWPNTEPQNAYSGSYDSSLGSNPIPNYQNAAEVSAGTPPPPYSYNNHSPPNPAGITGINAYDILTPAEHRDRGQQRRVALAPVVDCTQFSGATSCGSQLVPILGYACVLMLNPIKGPNDVVLEYLGQPNTPGTPCASYGLAGGSGPLVPVLVQ